VRDVGIAAAEGERIGHDAHTRHSANEQLELAEISRTRGGVRIWPARLAVVSIRVYQLTLSPLLGPHCRFAPSCSQYTLEAIARYGLIRGAVLGARRIGRCHPFHEGGFDPVP